MEFATHYHGIADHHRKCADGASIARLAAVAEIVRTVPHTRAMLAAAWLHDVVGNTPASVEDVRAEFGAEIAGLVEMLTEDECPEGGGTARRIALASREAKTVKLASIIAGMRNVVAIDVASAKKRLDENSQLLPLLRDGDPTLWFMARDRIVRACEVMATSGEFAAEHAAAGL